MLYSKLVQGETRSQGTQLWNGRKEARGHPWRPFAMEGRGCTKDGTSRSPGP